MVSLTGHSGDYELIEEAKSSRWQEVEKCNNDLSTVASRRNKLAGSFMEVSRKGGKGQEYRVGN